MRIGIDGRALVSRMGGTGYYLLEIMRTLDVAMPDASFIIYMRGEQKLVLPSSRWTARVDSSWLRRLPGPSWSRLRIAHMAKRDGLTVFWAASAICPRNIGIPVIQTIYDLNHLIFPASMPPATRWGHYVWFAASVRESTRRVAISAGTADRVKEEYGVICSAVAVPGVSDAFIKSARTSAVRLYVLSVATREPRKNLHALLQAMTIFNASRASPVELWLVGGMGWGKAISSAGRALLAAPWVRQLGYVDSSELPRLYANAALFAFPSIYEGYGIPVAEACAAGTTVVTTDIPELREAAMGGVAFFTGTSPYQIADGLREAWIHKDSQRGGGRPHSWAEAGQIMARELYAAAEVPGGSPASANLKYIDR